MKARLEELQARVAYHEQKANEQTNGKGLSLSEPLSSPVTGNNNHNNTDNSQFPVESNQKPAAATQESPEQTQIPPSVSERAPGERTGGEETPGLQLKPLPTAPSLTDGILLTKASIPDSALRPSMTSQDIIIRDLLALQAQLSNKLNDLQQDGADSMQDQTPGNNVTRGISYY